VTDAAGAVTRDQAARLGITLLDSYIQIGTRSYPETVVDPDYLFSAMRAGVKVSTSQASDLERGKAYQKILSMFPEALYLSAGSFYTGNVAAARDWAGRCDPEGRLRICDSGTAAGKLGLSALLTARYAMSAETQEKVMSFSQKALNAIMEILFLDRLQFLAAGGRMSRTGAFFGDILHIKPAISPMPEGAQKVAVLRNQKDQIALALKRLQEDITDPLKAVIMLEYSDNREWVEKSVLPKVQGRCPGAQIFLQCVSLTSAVHMGPGTWGIAYAQLDEMTALCPVLP
jgi:DegV family protein with EDD domain